MNKEMTKGKNKEKLKEKSIDIEKYKANLPKFLKEQIAKYETIFDHNPTKDEIKSSLIGLLADNDDDFFKNLDQEHLDIFSQDYFYHEIYELYLERDDKKNTDKYLKKLPKERQERINSPFPHPIFDKVVMN